MEDGIPGCCMRLRLLAMANESRANGLAGKGHRQQVSPPAAAAPPNWLEVALGLSRIRLRFRDICCVLVLQMET
jgi:hypothetical protein